MLWFCFLFNLCQLSEINIVKMVSFFSESFSPNIADFFYSLSKVEFKLCIAIASLEMLKLGYKSCILITQYAATTLFGFLSKQVVTKNLCKSTTGVIDYLYFYLAGSSISNKVDLYSDQKLS